ncbi:hypothetical protein SKAU_G00314290 [Synaphobranchus kaupii]|uniref:Uncharacterized protein n=1 Tax=Synaphobranchus kaupii TaxID=118154 RepID=A0A9Q1ES99_SYNKA|nr:hypothetical protein SKAU_G00314290 [Synaphobranchus kaupii]
MNYNEELGSDWPEECAARLQSAERQGLSFPLRGSASLADFEKVGEIGRLLTPGTRGLSLRARKGLSHTPPITSGDPQQPNRQVQV